MELLYVGAGRQPAVYVDVAVVIQVDGAAENDAVVTPDKSIFPNPTDPLPNVIVNSCGRLILLYHQSIGQSIQLFLPIHSLMHNLLQYMDYVS